MVVVGNGVDTTIGNDPSTVPSGQLEVRGSHLRWQAPPAGRYSLRGPGEALRYACHPAGEGGTVTRTVVRGASGSANPTRLMMWPSMRWIRVPGRRYLMAADDHLAR